MDWLDYVGICDMEYGVDLFSNMKVDSLVIHQSGTITSPYKPDTRFGRAYRDRRCMHALYRVTSSQPIDTQRALHSLHDSSLPGKCLNVSSRVLLHIPRLITPS